MQFSPPLPSFPINWYRGKTPIPDFILYGVIWRLWNNAELTFTLVGIVLCSFPPLLLYKRLTACLTVVSTCVMLTLTYSLELILFVAGFSVSVTHTATSDGDVLHWVEILKEKFKYQIPDFFTFQALSFTIRDKQFYLQGLIVGGGWWDCKGSGQDYEREILTQYSTNSASNKSRDKQFHAQESEVLLVYQTLRCNDSWHKFFSPLIGCLDRWKAPIIIHVGLQIRIAWNRLPANYFWQ